MGNGREKGGIRLRQLCVFASRVVKEWGKRKDEEKGWRNKVEIDGETRSTDAIHET
jgi:hypothetical protein